MCDVMTLGLNTKFVCLFVALFIVFSSEILNDTNAIFFSIYIHAAKSIPAFPSSTALFDTPTRDKVRRQQNEIDELNIFECLEKRLAHSFVGSTPIQSKSSNMMANADGKNRVGRCIRTASIRPARCAVSQRSGDPRIIEMSTDQDALSSYSSDDEEPRHVHFASHAIKYLAPDATTPIPDETNSILNESIADDTGLTVNNEDTTGDGAASIATPSTESFQRFKEKLFNRKLNQDFRPQLSVAGSMELDKMMDEDELVVADDTTSQFQPTAVQRQLNPQLAADLQAKGELLQTRLEELETEIASFKEQNAELTKLIREHDIIRLEFEEERQHVQEQLNDERCKIEVYLHDENMKLVNERKELDRRAKEMQRPNRSERDEIVKLREQCAHHETELTNRDQKHVAAQARIRAQLRNVEKERKELQFEVENLRRENKKLETENTRLRRQSNNKMLLEINRNIAKLAPRENGGGSENALNNNNIDEAQRGTETRRPSRGIRNKGAKECSNRSVHRTVVKKVTLSRSGTPCDGTQRMRSKSVPNLQAHDDDSVEEYELQNVSDSDSTDARSAYFGRSASETRARRMSSRESITERHKSPYAATSVSHANFNESTNSSDGKTNHYKRVIENGDGSRDVWYPNGNLKKISADGMCTRMLYYNKDIKETNITEGTVKYYYAESNTWHTTYVDGLEILEFPK